jgi:hypothetical protein
MSCRRKAILLGTVEREGQETISRWREWTEREDLDVAKYVGEVRISHDYIP